MDDSFFATLKLITGEEILAEVTSMNENETDFFLVNDPSLLTDSHSLRFLYGICHFLSKQPSVQ